MLPGGEPGNISSYRAFSLNYSRKNKRLITLGDSALPLTTQLLSVAPSVFQFKLLYWHECWMNRGKKKKKAPSKAPRKTIQMSFCPFSVHAASLLAFLGASVSLSPSICIYHDNTRCNHHTSNQNVNVS